MPRPEPMQCWKPYVVSDTRPLLLWLMLLITVSLPVRQKFM